MLKNFTIDENYLCDVTVRTEHNPLKRKAELGIELTDEEKIDALTGRHIISWVSSKDHDEFTKLRNMLEKLGYIQVERAWCNGDIVLRSFKLNGFVLRRHGKFCCAAAVGNSVKVARKYGYKHLN